MDYLVQLAQVAVVPAGQLYAVALADGQRQFLDRRHVGGQAVGVQGVLAEIEHHIVLGLKLRRAGGRDVELHRVFRREIGRLHQPGLLRRYQRLRPGGVFPAPVGVGVDRSPGRIEVRQILIAPDMHYLVQRADVAPVPARQGDAVALPDGQPHFLDPGAVVGRGPRLEGVHPEIVNHP